LRTNILIDYCERIQATASVVVPCRRGGNGDH
jgi:hypothetical protein